MARRTTLLPALLLSPALFLPAASFAQSSSIAPQSSYSQGADVQLQKVQGNSPGEILQPANPPTPIPSSVTPRGLETEEVDAQDVYVPSSEAQSSEQGGYSQVRIVRPSHVEGDVRIDRNDHQGFIKAFSNMPLIEGARLWTEADGRAEVEFEDGSTIRLTPGTMLDLRQLRLGRKGERFSTVALERGQAYFEIKKRGDDKFAVSLDPGRQQLILKKHSHFRVTVDREGLQLADFKGRLELAQFDGKRVKIGNNESLSLAFADPDLYFLARGTTPDPLDSWDRERDQQLAVIATNQSPAYNAPYSAAYSYGLEDLARYGSYMYSPGLGYVWHPYGAPVVWDPFKNGSWVWFPQYNYVFVSSYPWGWTPYHYGSWVNVNGVGWCWRPNGNTNFVPLANVVNAPPGFRPIRPPRLGSGGVIPVGGGVAVVNNPGTRGRGTSGTQVGNGSVVAPPVTGRPERLGVTPFAVDSSRIGRSGRGNNVAQQSNSAPVVMPPAVRPVQTPAAPVNTMRSERGPRSERMQSMPAPMHALPVQRMQAMPQMSAPSHMSSPPSPAMSAPGPSSGGRGRRDK